MPQLGAHALSTLERRGYIEATEEHHPVHLHVAVLAAPGSRVVLPNLVQGMVAAARVPITPVQTVSNVATANGEVSLPAMATRTYVVRQGDTLFDIANRTGLTVQAIAAANGRAVLGTLKPGTTLKLPAAAR
jgi:Membrane proteins related to metalloendopeptidases